MQLAPNHAVKLSVSGHGSVDDVYGSGDRSRVVIGHRHGLIAGSHQGETGKGAGACIRSGKYVKGWKLGGSIGGGEVYGAVDDCVSLSVIHCGHRGAERGACDDGRM